MVCGCAVLGRMSLPDWYLRLFTDKFVTEATICKYQFHSFSDICKRMLKMLTLHLGKVMVVLANLMYTTYLGETEARKLLKTFQIFSPNGGLYLLCHFVASAYIVHQLKSELLVMVG
jgi:hypothetical protein